MEGIIEMHKSIHKMCKICCAYLKALQITYFSILPNISALLTILSSAELTNEERINYLYQLENQHRQLSMLWSRK